MGEISCLQDIEEIAKRKLPPNILDYYRSGADEMQTLRENKSAFKKYRFLPRVLVDVSRRDLSTIIFGREINFPIGISPTAMQRMANPEGECASARAAQDAGTIFILSTAFDTNIEEIAEAAPKAIKWLQLFIYKDKQITSRLVARAEAAGYSALVLTVDSPVLGKRRSDIRNKFAYPAHIAVPKLDSNKTKNSKDENSSISHKSGGTFDLSITWKDLQWLSSITKLPVVVKGILHPDDARLAASHGARAVMVSNHGGRQLDGVPATIDCLQDISEALVGTGCEVYLDGGIRMGTDVLKALALGAKMVFIGRPVIWGLAYDGQAGVTKTLELLKNELDLSMALSGCTAVNNISKDLILLPKSKY